VAKLVYTFYTRHTCCNRKTTAKWWHQCNHSNKFCEKFRLSIILPVVQPSKKPLVHRRDEYHNALLQSRFVLSPPGTGIDCIQKPCEYAVLTGFLNPNYVSPLILHTHDWPVIAHGRPCCWVPSRLYCRQHSMACMGMRRSWSHWCWVHVFLKCGL